MTRGVRAFAVPAVNGILLGLIAVRLLVIILFGRSDLLELGPVLSRAATALFWSTLPFTGYPLYVLASWHFSRDRYPILVTLLRVPRHETRDAPDASRPA